MLPCHVVQDLLPLYLDDLASAETKALLAEHLAGCESCRAVKEKMEKNPPLPKAEPLELRLLNFLKDTLFLRVAAAALALLLTAFAIDFIYYNTNTGYGAYSPEQVLYEQLFAADPEDPDYRFTILTKEENEDTGVILLCSRWENGPRQGVFWHRFEKGPFGGYALTGEGTVEGEFQAEHPQIAQFYSENAMPYTHAELLRGDFVAGYPRPQTVLILMALACLAGLLLTWWIVRPLLPRRKARQK